LIENFNHQTCLFNINRKEAISLLLKAMKCADKDLKSNIILLPGSFAKPYRNCLKDKDHRIRALALKRLAEGGGGNLQD